MVAYVMTGSGTLRDIGNAGIWGVATARAGGDTIDTNGFNVTIDQDTRYGLSGGTTLSLGSVTTNAAKGGAFNIDATKVWNIPFTGGSGTLTLGTQITIGGVTCNTIGIHTALTAAPATTGASGWLKVTNASGTPGTITSGTYAGFTLTANGAAVRGWIEVVGDEASTINANRLGPVNITGEWFEVGTASGSSATTYQLPTNGSIQYYPAVWVETSNGSGVYEAYPCAGSLVAAASTPTDAVRGKVCWASTAGVLRFGSDGTNTVGYVPPAGCKIRMPNILLVNCTTAARQTNALPNATLATRYDFTTTGGGVINMSKVNCCWYPSQAQAYSSNLSYVGIAEQLSVSEIAQPLVWDNVAVGQCAAQTNVALVMALCFAGGTISNCRFSRATQATAVYVRTLTDIAGFTFTGNKWFSLVLRNATAAYLILDSRVVDTTFTNEVHNGEFRMTTCTNVTVTDLTYYDCITTTGTANPMSVWTVTTNCKNILLDGLSFGGLTNVQPYTAILSIAAAGCSQIKLRNIGTYASKLSLGSTNATGLVYALATGAAASDVKIQRVYVANTRTGVMTGDNSSTRVIEETVHGDYADAADVAAVLNYTRKGRGGTIAVTAQTAVYGTHWYDMHLSTTAGRIGFMLNEPTALTTSQVTLTSGAAFTSVGSLYMPTIGMTATFETPEYVIGHTAFQNSAAIMAGGTATNYTYGFQIDKNDGNGWSTLTSGSTATTLATALNALTGIDAAKGFKLRIKITTGTANTTAITSFYLLTSSTTTTQAYQYPLDVATVTVNGLVTGSRVKAYKVSDSTVLFNGPESSGAVSFTTDYIGAVGIDARKASSAPYYAPWVTVVTTVAGATSSATALQQLDE